jgi:polyisoprenoid-binding protein YceI
MAAPDSLIPVAHWKLILNFMKKTLRAIALCAVVTALTSLLGAEPSAAQELLLQLDPAKSGADITVSASMHTVHGSFAVKRGTIHFHPATGKASGEIVIDAASGQTGNGSRDHKMHKDVIQSQRYPEIVFHPDRADGTLSSSGGSTLQVHGLFDIHGGEHEVTIPVQVNFVGSAWTAKASFQVPYVKWGMKNPSVLFLRVGDTVQVQFHAAGTIAQESHGMRDVALDQRF